MNARRAFAAALALAVAIAARAQQPAPTPPPAPPAKPAPAPGEPTKGEPTKAPPAKLEPAPPEDLARADALLALHAARSRGARVLVADYVQRRTTELVKTPLESRGRFLFVRDPAIVVFFAASPRPSVVRLGERVYEVHRPQKKQLERHHLDGPELARGLFAAVGGDVAPLRRDFEVVKVVATAATPAAVQIQLVARDPAVRARIQGLDLTLRASDGLLVEVAYRDHAGDRVAIELQNLELDPAAPPAADLQLEPGTTVLEHGVRR